MTPRILCLTVSITILCGCGTPVPDGGMVDSARVHFGAYKLSTEKVRTIVELANECGIQKVTDVKTHLLLPTKSSGIRVEGDEVVIGRKVTRLWAEIYYQPLLFGTPSPEAKGRRGFWVNPPYLHTNEFTVFQSGDESVRVRLSKEIPLETADKIFSLLSEKKLVFSSNSSWIKSFLERLNDRIVLTKPVSLSSEGNLYCATYWHLGSGYTLNFRLGEGQLEIVSLGNINI